MPSATGSGGRGGIASFQFKEILSGHSRSENPLLIVLARYKKWKIWARLALIALIILAIPIASIWLFGPTDDGRKYHFAERSQIILAWFLAIPLAFGFIATFRQVVFHGGRLLWIENENVVWKDPNSFSVPCADILKVSCGTGGKFDQLDTITFRLRDGSEKVIETDSLAEACDDVVHRLKDILGLTSSMSDDRPLFRV